MTIFENEPLGARTTFKIGGSVRFLIEVYSSKELNEAYAFAREKQLPVFILGGGSNVLADDGIANGVCIVPKITGVEYEAHGDDTHCTVGVGESWDALVERTVVDGWWGIENLSGIPGSVGGAVVQNAGAYGVEIGERLAWVEAYEVASGALVRLSREACVLGYRQSRFKTEPGQFVLVRVALTLTKHGVANISYRDLAERFAGVSAPSGRDIRGAVLSIRAQKFPDLSVEGTAGSFFKNPSLPLADAQRLADQYPGLPVFTNVDGVTAKISLAWLFDKVLHLRGANMGEVRAYENQPLVIVARNTARAQDVRMFAASIQKRAHDTFGIRIEPEVCVMHGAATGTAL